MFSRKIIIFICIVLILAISIGVDADVKIVSSENGEINPNITTDKDLTENEITSSENGNDKFTFNMLIVLTLVVFLIVMFLLEVVRIDFIGLSIPVILVFLQKWTGVTATEAISGFSNNATITVLAMFIISGGVYRSGIVQILVEKIEAVTGDNEIKQVGIVSGLSGLIAGIVNNTPVVALFIPLVKELARKTQKSPSKLLMPLSFGAMMGGMLTLIGTNTNLVASNISERLIGRSFSVFEFTRIGLIALIVGVIYLIIIGRHLIPDRIAPEREITEEYGMRDFLTEVVIREDSPLTGKTVGESLGQSEHDIDLVEIIRDEEQFVESMENKVLKAGDHLIIRADHSTLIDVLKDQRLRILPGINVTQEYLEQGPQDYKVIEIVIPNDSFMIGQTLNEANFVERYNSCVLAIRRGEELTHLRMDKMEFKAGDILLIMAGEATMDRLRANKNFVVTNEIEAEDDFRRSKMFLATGILIGVIVLAVLEVVPIVISALAGVLLMVITGCLQPNEVYESVNWEIVFLLAGVIPLGAAMEKTGTAGYLATRILSAVSFLSPVLILGLFYLITALLTNVISRNASIVFMLPIAVDAARQLGVHPFPFILVVTFAVGCSFLTPIGNQINLMVYSPGGYRFRDFLIVGGPLQLIYTFLIPVLVTLFFPL